MKPKIIVTASPFDGFGTWIDELLSVDVNRMVSRVRLYEVDHEPDGWPAVEMSFLSELADALEGYESAASDLSVSAGSLLEAGDELVTAIESYFDENDSRPTMQICSALKEWREANKVICQ